MATENHGGIKETWNSLMRGVGSLLRTGAWNVENAADEARSAKQSLDEYEAAADQYGQEALTDIDEALTAYHGLQIKAERLQTDINYWTSQATVATTETKKHAEGTPERIKFETMAMNAFKKREAVADRQKPYLVAIEAGRAQNEQNLQMIEQAGLSREIATAQRERLDITRATSEARKKMASAGRNGSAAKMRALLDEATERVDKLSAEAAADEDIAARLPADETTVDAQISMLTRDDRAKAAFDEMMAKTETPAGTAAG